VRGRGRGRWIREREETSEVEADIGVQGVRLDVGGYIFACDAFQICIVYRGGAGRGFIISGGGNICMALLYSTRTGWYDEFLESDA
jgi:hypothetical protein